MSKRFGLNDDGDRFHQAMLEQPEAKQQMIADVAEAARSPTQSFNIERLDGPSAIRDKLDELFGACKEEVWSFNPDGPRSSEDRSYSRAAEEETLRRGVRIRAVCLNLRPSSGSVSS